MNKRPDITDATRGHLLQAFCDAYRTEPIERITVKQVAERAGYNRITFYRYFKDVYDARDYLEEDFLPYAMAEIQETIRGGIQHEEFLRTFLQVFTEKKGYVEVLMNEKNVGHTMGKIKETMLPIILDSFGVAADDRTARYVFEFYVSGVLSLCSFWLQNQRDISGVELVHVIEQFLKGGVLPQISKAK